MNDWITKAMQIVAAADRTNSGDVTLVEFRHDHDCPMITGTGDCICDDVEIGVVTDQDQMARNLARDAKRLRENVQMTGDAIARAVGNRAQRRRAERDARRAMKRAANKKPHGR